MLDERAKTLSRYRLDKSYEDLIAAKEMLKLNMFKQSINRSYYSIFHAVRALLALDNVDFKRHSGVISYFQSHYVRSGEFDKLYSSILTSANIVRNQSDYDDFFLVTKEDAEKQMSNAEKFFATMKEYLDTKE